MNWHAFWHFLDLAIQIVPELLSLVTWLPLVLAIIVVAVGPVLVWFVGMIIPLEKR